MLKFSSEKKELLWKKWTPDVFVDFHSDTPIWRLHAEVYEGEWNVSANNSGTVGHKDLRLEKIVFILVFYNISFSWLFPVDSFQFIFLLRDSENDVHCRRVYTVQTFLSYI